jgi:hypothetical protein
MRVIRTLEDAYYHTPKKFKLLGTDAQGLNFLSVTVQHAFFIVCVAGGLDRDTASIDGFLRLEKCVAKIDGKNTPVYVPQSFLMTWARGRGTMLGMYQWALQQRSLMTEAEQTPDSHALWRRLAKTYNVQTLQSIPGSGFRTVPDGDWTAPNIHLYIKA